MAQFKRFNPGDSIKPFDCGEADLNGFLLELVTPQEGDETVLMYYDLKKFVSVSK